MVLRGNYFNYSTKAERMQRTLSKRANIALNWVDDEHWCVHTGAHISVGTPAVVIWSPSNRSKRRAISIGAVEGLQSHLSRTADGNARVNKEIASQSKIKYGRVSDDVTCFVCEKPVEAHTVALSVYTSDEQINNSYGIHRPSPLRCHQSCLPVIIDALDEVWQYTAEIMGDVA